MAVLFGIFSRYIESLNLEASLPKKIVILSFCNTRRSVKKLPYSAATIATHKKKIMKNNNQIYKTLVSLVSFVTLTVVLASTAGAQKQEEYHILGERQTGSRIPPEVVTSLIPLDLTYEELSDKDKAFIKANYDNMPAEDEPPFPENGLMGIWKPIAESFHRSNQIGEIIAVATIDPKGKVEKVAMYKTTSNDMTKMISTALFATKFKPAVCDSKPCTMDFILEGELNIDLMRD